MQFINKINLDIKYTGNTNYTCYIDIFSEEITYDIIKKLFTIGITINDSLNKKQLENLIENYSDVVLDDNIIYNELINDNYYLYLLTIDEQYNLNLKKICNLASRLNHNKNIFFILRNLKRINKKYNFNILHKKIKLLYDKRYQS